MSTKFDKFYHKFQKNFYHYFPHFHSLQFYRSRNLSYNSPLCDISYKENLVKEARKQEYILHLIAASGLYNSEIYRTLYLCLNTAY